MALRGSTNIDKMRDEAPPAFMNSFIAGLKTEFTGMNFPPNAATDCDNVIFDMKGDVLRRPGIDLEQNHVLESLGTRDDKAINSYVWKNAGGDGESQLMVVQVGFNLYFYVITDSTFASPMSAHRIASSVNIVQFGVTGVDGSAEVQFTDGNGYLFCFTQACDPFYVTYDPIGKTVTAAKIDVNVRDFLGYPEAGVDPTHRDQVLTVEHEYNLRNQGWTRAPLWSVIANDYLISDNMGDAPGVPIPFSFTGNGIIGVGVQYGFHVFNVAGGLPISVATPVDITYSIPVNIYDIQAVQWTAGSATGSAIGVVTSYDTGTGVLIVNITSTTVTLHTDNLEFAANPGSGALNGPVQYNISASKSINTIDTWYIALGNYPANADIWWIFKDQTDKFNPSATIGNKGLPSAWAPKGHYILPAFNQDRDAAANTASQFGNVISGLVPLTTLKRPRTGTFFQGRVWYTGVDDSQQKSLDQNFYTWTENIYFSRIVEGVDDFGKCYEDNDPTDQYSFNLLPSDGGVIVIQGCGAIYKLFPIQNGMLVFAANGIWFITGSQGIGFSASDYTITKISGVRSISSTSYVDVNGLPMFWNEEGIYTVAPAQQGLGLTVDPLTVGTIKTFYENIPIDSKKLARGSYNPVEYVVQWIYKDAQSISSEAVTSTTPGGMPFNGYQVTTGLTANGSYKVDSFGTNNLRLDPATNGDGINAWTIPGNVFTNIDPGLTHGSFGSLSAVGVHALADGTFATRGSNASGGGSPSNDVMVIDSSGTVVHQIADALTGASVNLITSICDFGGNLIGMTTAGPTHNAQVWKCNPTTDATLTVNLIADGAKIEANNWVAGPTYVYSFNNTDGVTSNGYTKARLINWSTLTQTELDFSALPSPMVNITYDVSGGHAIIITHDGTVYKYSQDLLTQIAVSTTGLLGLTGKAVNSAKRMCNNGHMWVTNPTGAGGTWNIMKVDLSTLTILNTYNSADTIGGFQISTDADKAVAYFWAVWNEFEQGFFMVMHSGAYAFWPVPRSGTQFTLNADSYQFNRALNFNTFTKAFYPWTFSDADSTGNAATPSVHHIHYVAEPGGLDSYPGGFKYPISTFDGSYHYSFADVTDGTYLDWDYVDERTGDDYLSYFVTGYDMSGQGLRQFQPNYVSVYTRNPTSQYFIQGIWDFASSPNSGKWSTKQKATFTEDPGLFGMVHKRHRVRGHGYTLQYKFSSVPGKPFDIMGWAQWTQQAASP